MANNTKANQGTSPETRQATEATKQQAAPKPKEQAAGDTTPVDITGSKIIEVRPVINNNIDVAALAEAMAESFRTGHRPPEITDKRFEIFSQAFQGFAQNNVSKKEGFSLGVTLSPEYANALKELVKKALTPASPQGTFG